MLDTTFRLASANHCLFKIEVLAVKVTKRQVAEVYDIRSNSVAL